MGLGGRIALEIRLPGAVLLSVVEPTGGSIISKKPIQSGKTPGNSLIE